MTALVHITNTCYIIKPVPMTEYFLKSFYAECLFGMLRSFFHRVIFSSVFLQEKMLGHLC